jgi:uncharacterized protein (TIGR00369 family)
MNPTTSRDQQRDMSRYLGDGGMPILGQLGASFEEASDGAGRGSWTPTGLACNPRGAVQGGILAVVLDAAMSLALHSILPRGETAFSLELKVSQPQPVLLGRTMGVRGNVVRSGGTIIFAVADVVEEGGEIAAQASGTFLRRRIPRSNER